MENTVRWLDRIWFGLLLILIFFSPLVMFRSPGHILIKEIAPDIVALPHYVPKLTNLVFKEIFCLGLILILFYLTLFKKILLNNLKFTRSKLDIPILLFLVLSGISVFYSATQGISFRDWTLLATFILFGYLIIDEVKEIKKIRWILYTIIASAVVTAFFATCQHLGFYLWGFLVQAEDRNRMMATIGHNNGVASYMMLASFAIIALQSVISDINKMDKIRRYFLLVLLLWFFFVILATLSRGVWIGTIAGILIYLSYLIRNQGGLKLFFKQHYIKIGIIIFLGLIFFGTLSFPNRLNPMGVSIIHRVRDTLFRRETYIKDDRIRMWVSSFEIIREHPFRGVGLGAFKYWIPIYQGKYFERNPDSILEPTFKLTNQSHNEYIQVWAELGVFGFIISLWLIYLYFQKGYRLYSSNKTSQGINSLFYVSLFCATIGILFQSLVDFPLHIPSSGLLFICYIAIVLNRDNIKLELDEQYYPTDFKINFRKILAMVLSGVLLLLVFIPFWRELRSDWYKNRLSYFLHAAEQFRVDEQMELRNKSLQHATEYGQKAVQWDNKNARAHYKMALGYLKLQQIPSAIHHFELALQNMQYADLHFYLAEAYEWMSRYYLAQGDKINEEKAIEKAIEHYRMASFIYPVHRTLAREARAYNLFYMPVEAQHRLGILLRQQNRLDEAIEVWSNIAVKDPIYLEEYYYNLATEYRWKSDFTTAIRILEQAYILDNTNMETITRLGVMHLESGNYAEVLNYLDIAFALDSTLIDLHYGYAVVYDRLNQPEKSIKWAEKTLSLNSTHHYAQQLLDRLKKR